jgi:hypothetical protein
MQKNMGQTDRFIRVVAAVVLGLMIVTGVLSGTWALVLGFLAVVFLLTSALSFCPLYLPLKFSTRHAKDGK